jgi:dynein heavy chain, axonemal
MQDISAIIARVDDLLADHNAGSRRPMNLAMFLYAAEHVARAVRVLRQPGAHLLSIGVGGSGRASVARLAASIAGIQAQQIEVTKSYGLLEWKEDLKKFTRMYDSGNTFLLFMPSAARYCRALVFRLWKLVSSPQLLLCTSKYHPLHRHICCCSDRW